MKSFRVLSALILAALLSGSVVVTFAQSAPPNGSTPISWSADRIPGNKISVSTGWKNYYDGGWKKIDLEPRLSNGTFVVDKAPYKLTAPEYADQSVVFTSTTPFDPDTKQFHTEKPVSKTKTFAGVTHVKGTQDGDSIVYPGAHPLGDLLYKPTEDGFQALVRINSIPATCTSNPSGNVTVPFSESYSDSLTPDGIGTTQRNIGSGWKTEKNQRRIVTKEADIWDARGKRQKIVVNGKMSAGTLIASKVLPCDFLLSATYPVLTDTTTSVIANAGDGVISFGNGTWANVFGATAGDGISTVQSESTVGSFFVSGTTYASYIIYLYFDTSSLGSCTPGAADIVAYFPHTGLSQQHIYYAVKNRQASDTLALGDFDNIGDSGPGTGDIYGSFTRTAGLAAGDQTASLSAAGLANINDAGNSYFALLDANHWNNVAPTAQTVTGNGNDMAMTDAAGTDNDPELLITCGSAGGSGGSTKKPIFWLSQLHSSFPLAT